MKKVVISGALGYIGFHLINELLKEGFEVIGIDNVNLDIHGSIQEERLLHFGRNALFQFINEDIVKTDLEGLEDVSVFYHFAEELPNRGKLSFIKNNVVRRKDMIEKIAQFCRFNNTHLIYPSSIEVYGNQKGEIEESSPPQPSNLYGELKLTDETFIKQSSEAFNIPFSLLRLPLIYSTDSRETFQQHNKFYKSIQFKSITPIHIKNAVKALMLTAEQPSGVKICNVSEELKRDDNQSTSINDKRFREYTGFSPTELNKTKH